MNARLYDPVLGRMISPDNFVTGAFASQAYNRYSYANNNPLKYTDPSGNHPVLVAIAIAAVMNIAQQVMYNEGFNNFNVESLVLSMIQGAISAGIAGGIGDLIKPLTGFTKLAAGVGLHGLSGGLQAAVFGGNIGQGVLSGMIGHGVGELFVGAGVSQNMGLLGNFVVGGMSSALVATAMGNDPMQAFIIGGATAAFNSFMHQGGDEDGMTQYERNQQNPTLAIDAFWGLFGTLSAPLELGYTSLKNLVRNPKVARVLAKFARRGFSKFNNLDELAGLFKGKNLGNATDDLLNAGWSEVKGKWGTKTIFQKQIGKERFYAIWESSNMEHSINNLPTSYWKLTRGKISAYGDNVRRVSDAPNFIFNGKK
jgi:hypothetical protein